MKQQKDTTTRKQKKKTLGLILATLVLLLVVVCIAAIVRDAPSKQELASLSIGTIDFSNLQDGVFTGSFVGSKGSQRDATVEVTVSNGAISNIRVLKGAVDVSGVATDIGNGKTVYDLFDAVLSQETMQVDGISGATLTSNAHLKALENALLQAQKGETQTDEETHMKIAVVSYSHTGNNARFADHLSRALNADAIELSTQHPVNYGTITLDLIFQRKPAIRFSGDQLKPYDLVLLVAPVWMGQVAFPMRRCLDALQALACPYGFLSVCGGADGNNPNLTRELTRRAGRAPAIVLEQHIRALLPQEPAPTRDDTSAYRLTDEDCDRFTKQAIAEIQKQIPIAR